jgi:sugar diacid utilization regulator
VRRRAILVGAAGAGYGGLVASDPGSGRVVDGDLAAVVQRLSQRLEAIGDVMVERYRETILDYADADEALLEDVRTVSLDNARSLLANVLDGTVPTQEVLERSATAAARRVHQGIPLEAFLHAFRLWAQIFWEQVLAEARTDRAGEREAALQLAGRLMAHVDLVSSSGALAYLEEVQGVWSDQEVLRRDLLELLLSGDDPAAARRHAASLGIALVEDYAVVVLRARERSAADGTAATPVERSMLRDVIVAARAVLGAPRRPALVGLRHGEVVALRPAAGRGEHDEVRAEAATLAGRPATAAFAIGLGGLHPGLGGVAPGFGEAREAARAAALRARGTAVAFDDVLVTHLLRTSPDADRLLGDLLQPVVAYDADRRADLVATLRAYVAAGFSPTRSAHELTVHANTVLYRLKRIRELTGRDPQDPDDLVLLALALKHLDAR